MVLDLDIAPDGIRRLRRSEYDQMVEAGIIAENEKVELLEGILVTMSPEGPAHAEVVSRLIHLFVTAVGARAQVRAANPLAATEDSEPEPDLALVPPGVYWSEHPTKTFLVIEVAHTSLRKDRGLKRRVYARAGVPEYWVINLKDRVIDVFTRPTGEDYGEVQRAQPGEILKPTAFPDVTVPVADLLPPAG
jgi:Uma2 family endonuclease